MNSPATPVSASSPSQGSVTLIGGGPGAWDLVTVRGMHALREADVILADHLGPVANLEKLCDVQAKEIIDVAKLPYSRRVSQDQINSLLVAYAREGKKVARLKGGDPYVFGRGYEELSYCRQHGIEVTVIPGVTSAISVPAAVDIPITQRGVTHSFTVVSGHLPPQHPRSLVNWSALAQSGGTLVVLMGVRNVKAITRALIEEGKSPETPAAVISAGTTHQQISARATLGTLARVMQDQKISNPAVYVIGEVADL